ncbi:MAG: HupE/UreJ family protein [Pseudomonadota bacterium]|nr:HupE/UreJ family protein [Pseudomonadota bacterium]
MKIQRTKNIYANRLIAALLASAPVLAMAHLGHEHGTSGFVAGFVHPFTGLDHLVMAIALGVLFAKFAQRWKVVGMLSFALALIFGFVLGMQGIFANIAEYGIVASLVVLAVALLARQGSILAVASIALTFFHGAAHGVELAHAGHAALVIAGMVLAMALIYAFGLGLGEVLRRYVPHGEKIVAVCATVVAAISLG